MSFLSAFSEKAINLEDAFQAKDITSGAMSKAIAEWNRMYYNQAKTEEEDPCQQIPFTIVRKLTKTMFSEYVGTAENDFAVGILKTMERVKERAVQKALICGECAMKPIPKATGWGWTIIPRTAMLVFGRNDDGDITDMGTMEQTDKGPWTYTLLERRTVENGYLTIRNMLYRSDSSGSIGVRVPLALLPKYENLPEEYTFTERLDSVGLVFLKTPIENNVDGSADGVSVYSAAAGLIHNINRNEAQLSGEFERGKSRVFISDDLANRRKDGSRGFDDEIFIGVDGSPDETGVTIFSPNLRDESYHRRKQDYLRACESVIGLKRGILSEVEQAQRTATEITSSDGDYNLTIIDFQHMWTKAVAEAMRICGILGRLYKLPNARDVAEGEWSLAYGDGVLYNPEREEAMRYKQVQAGLLKPELYLAWYYDLPAQTESDLARIRKEYMPEVLEGE